MGCNVPRSDVAHAASTLAALWLLLTMRPSSNVLDSAAHKRIAYELIIARRFIRYKNNNNSCRDSTIVTRHQQQQQSRRPLRSLTVLLHIEYVASCTYAVREHSSAVSSMGDGWNGIVLEREPRLRLLPSHIEMSCECDNTQDFPPCYYSLSSNNRLLSSVHVPHTYYEPSRFVADGEAFFLHQ